jgi:dihydroxyacetone kinase
MNDSLSAQDLMDGIARMCRALIDHADEFTALDAAMGDGDMGVTMRAGCQAVLDGMNALAGADAAEVLLRCGMTFNRVASSTIGTLLATAAMRASKEAKGATAINLPLLARMVAAAEKGVRERGKAGPGDKTLLDALIPARSALDDAAAQGLGLPEAGRRALAAAEAGCAATIPMRSQVGRASWVGDRTIGQPDPGATAVVIMFRAAVAESG